MTGGNNTFPAKTKVEEYIETLFQLYGGGRPPQHIFDHYTNSLLNATLSPVAAQQEIEFLCTGKRTPATTPNVGQYQGIPTAPSLISSSTLLTSNVTNINTPELLAASLPSVPGFPTLDNNTPASPLVPLPIPTAPVMGAPVPFASTLPSLSTLPTPQPPQPTIPNLAKPFSAAPTTPQPSQTPPPQSQPTPQSVLADGSDKPERVKAYVKQLYMTYVGKVDVGAMKYIVRSLLDGSYTLTQAELSVKYSKEAKERAKQLEKEQEEINKRKKRLEEYVNELFRVYVKVRKPSTEELESYVSAALTGKSTLQQLEDSIVALGIESTLPSVPPSNVPRKK
eukprot:TRINITY_DN8130_c0_g1_i1.p1 TRINITY_DN8130_c0_g1~~TRINITY_DN8130_c0_g1_i1.p1  ORF type:complete len:338 (+),score=98.05 TRINITY_DN8130_c0_g1_i1:191-1204(+)